MQGTSLEGDTPSVKDVVDLDMHEGRYFNENDLERSAPVVVLGQDTADELFGERCGGPGGADWRDDVDGDRAWRRRRRTRLGVGRIRTTILRMCR